MRHNIKSILPIIAVVITLIMAVSCGHRPTRDALERADALIDEHADSALTVLQTIDTTRLSGRRDRALYGLLMTQALVKLHRPVTSDSLIAPAARYFAAGNDRHHAMRALYYHGVVKYDNEQYPAAMVQFFRARDIATDLGDHFWAGLACRGISDTYHQAYNIAEALLYAKKAYAHFLKSGKWLYIRYSKLDLATEYCSVKDFDAATRLLSEVVDTAMTVGDPTLEYYARRLMALNHYNNGDFEAALPCYQAICRMGDAEPDDSVYLALTELALGNVPRATELYDTVSGATEIRKRYLLCGILKARGNAGQALEAREQFDEMSDSLFNARSNIHLTSTVTEVMRDSNLSARSDLRAAKMSLWVIVLASMLIIGAVGAGTWRIVKTQRVKIEKNVNLAAQLQLLLSQKDNENAKSAETIDMLLSARYSMLEEICRTLIIIPDEASQKRKVSQMMSALMKDLSRDSAKIAELGKDADKLYDGIYRDFCKDFPQLKDQDRRLFLFSVHKFSYTAIQFFLGEDKVSAVYDRKRHLKDKIKKLPPEKSRRYLSFLG